MEITITKAETLKQKPSDDILGFGKYFTDHMFVMEYTKGKGWHSARIQPFQSLSLHPAATVFHYGAEVFEGLKAYRKPDGKVQLFRPMENIKRLNRSAERLCLPLVDEEFVLKALTEFVKVEQDWVPSSPETSLYLRPFLFGNDEYLGLHTQENALFLIIASPVGCYYPEGLAPVKIMIETEDVRAVRGGTGETKCGGNYAASNRAGAKAENQGFTQVLWLDGVHQRYIEEVGSMNVMFLIGDEIITPALNGSILPGITRKSCLEYLKSKGYQVSERQFSVEELGEALKAGTLKEAWGCGTAAVISPIGQLKYYDEVFTINSNEIGPVTKELYQEITGIQWGHKPDSFDWCMGVD